MDPMSLFIIAFAAILLIGVVIAVRQLIAYLSPNRSEQWAAIAQSLGWEYDPKKKHISGIYRGRQINLDRLQPARTASGIIGAGIASQSDDIDAVEAYAGIVTPRLRVRAQIKNPAGDYLSLLTVAEVSAIERALSKPVQTEIEEIDQRFSVESKPARFAGLMLRKLTQRNRLLELSDRYPFSLAIKGDKLNLQVSALEPNETVILPILDLACDIADSAERASLGE